MTRLPVPGIPTVVGIVSSAGGPRALRTVLDLLPGTFPLPILVVQHMSPGFTQGLATWLDETVALPVGLATHGAAAGPGVHIAPEGTHLVLGAGNVLRLTAAPADAVHRPSADVLLTSLATVARRGALAVVLTGMGRDGAEGVRAVLEAGGAAIAESEETAAIYGMPAAAAAEGATTLPLLDIGPILARAAVRPEP